jgi:hypothetical protein
LTTFFEKSECSGLLAKKKPNQPEKRHGKKERFINISVGIDV